MKLNRTNKLIIGLCTAAAILIAKLFSIQILDKEGKNEYNFSVQMMYNNRIGAKPEDIAVKQSND